MAAIEAGTTAAEEISLRDLIADFARARILVLGFALGGALVAGAIGLLSSDQYEARVVLAPTLEEANSAGLGGLSGLASQYSGLAALAGISLGGGGKKDESVATLKSELLTSAYIREQNLLPVLFARRWDADNDAWRKGLFGGRAHCLAANQDFDRRIRRIAVDNKTGLIVVSIKWTDPVKAAKWVNDLVKKTNESLSDKAISEAARNIRYLNEQSKNTSWSRRGAQSIRCSSRKSTKSWSLAGAGVRVQDHRSVGPFREALIAGYLVAGDHRASARLFPCHFGSPQARARSLMRKSRPRRGRKAPDAPCS